MYAAAAAKTERDVSKRKRKKMKQFEPISTLNIFHVKKKKKNATVSNSDKCKRENNFSGTKNVFKTVCSCN